MSFESLLFDLSQLGGVILLVTVIINILKHFGLVKNGEKLANTVQFLISVILTVIGMAFPDWLDWLPFVDRVAELLAELGAFVIPVWLVIVKIGNLFHDIMTKIPYVSDVFAKRITAD